jgi:tetratricopeptide (TPR) repeat protein
MTSPPERKEGSDPTGERIDALASEVADTRKQMIKTANILGNLSADVRSVGRQHQQERRGLTLNSAAAYVLFVALLGSGFYFVYRSQMERLDYEKDNLVREHAAALTKLQSVREELDERKEAEAKAAAFYQLTRSRQRQRALRQYPDVAKLPLSRVEAAVFQQWASRVRNRLAYSAYSAGMRAVGQQQWKRATSEFRGALGYLPHPPHEASLRYYLGVALMKLGSYKEAALDLERALSAGAEKSVSRETRYHLGTVYEQMGRREKAIKAYKGYVKRHPMTSYARAARRKIKALK